MPDPAQAAKEYRLGMQLYAGGSFPDAISAFDRAISLGDRSFKVLDAKAATLNRMGERQAAFDLATELCKKFGEKNARPWYRIAMILSAMGMYDVAERSITKGLSLTSDVAVRKTLAELREKNGVLRSRAQANLSPEEKARRDAAAKRKLCFTHLLSYDVLLLIAQAGLAADPDFALRMAGVCTEWRRAVLDYSPLWSRLRVGKRRPVQKIAVWMERNRGRLRELIIDEVPPQVRPEVHAALTPYVEDLERISLAGDAARALRSDWAKQFRRLRSIECRSAQSGSLTIGDILHPAATELESIDGLVIRQEYPDLSGYETISPNGVPVYIDVVWDWATTPAHLQSLRRLNFTAHLLHPHSSLLNLLEHTPLLSEFCCTVKHTADAIAFPLRGRSDDPLALPNLTKVDLSGSTEFGIVVPPGIELPNLQHFSCYGLSTSGFGACPINALQNASVSWSKLVSLEFGRLAPVEQSKLLPLLPNMTALKFLNLPYCTSVDNTLIEALVVEDGKPVLLPNLTALSITGNDNISAGPIRRLVLSRNAPDKLTKAVAAPAPKRKASAFAPARKAVPSAPQTSAAGPSTPRPTVARLNWLCLDNCNHPYMDVRVLENVRPHLRFLSVHAGKPNDDRTRGRGVYAWNKPQYDVPDDEAAVSDREKRKAGEALNGERAAKVRG